jgi:NADH dehydrogenase FAD-containing subunit
VKKHLVLAGGGHAHMETLANLNRFVEKGYAITVIGSSGYHYYSGMGPGMLGGTYRPEEIRFATQKIVEKKGGRFILDTVVKIDPDAQQIHLASGALVSYDVLSCNLGSSIPRDILKQDGENIFTVKPIERLLSARERILERGSRKKITIGIIGGGPSAVEIAGNIEHLTRKSMMNAARIILLSRKTILPHHHPRIRGKALASLTARGIEVLTGCAVQQIDRDGVRLTSGNTHELDIIFVATGVTPSPVFKDSGILTGADGGLLVNRYLQSVTHKNIFGGGDCICFKEAPLDKVGVYAVRQNPVLFHNLMASLDGGALLPFTPGGDYLLIFNLGDGTGIFQKRRLLFGGRLAFIIKDRIDRNFMRKFQAIE